MKKLIKKIFLAFSFILLYLIVKEFLQLYTYLSNINEWLAVIVIVLIGFFLFYYGIIPIMQIIFLPPSLGPTKHLTEVPKVLEKRIKKLKGNYYLRQINFDFSDIQNDQVSYDKMINAISPECQRIRKEYVNKIFYGTAISQNGFLDAVIILSASVNTVRDIFLLYNGRVTYKDLISIAKKVYYSVAIGGSEGVNYASEEVFSKFSTESMQSIPLISKVLSSLADGYVNALLLTRISLITENYCTKLYIANEKELSPSAVFIVSTAKDLTKDIIELVINHLKKITKDKSESIYNKTVNSVKSIFDRSIESAEANNLDDSIKNIKNGRITKIKLPSWLKKPDV